MIQKSVDQATLEMIQIAEKQNLETTWDRWDKQQPQCGFGQLGVCCRICNMGPCRIDPFGGEPRLGACGADADTIVARHLSRMIAAGTAAHSDHGRDVIHTLHLAAKGEGGYVIKDALKLRRLADEFGLEVDGQSDTEVAQALGIEPGDDVEIFVADGQLTVIKKLKGAAKGMLRHVQSVGSMTDEESRQSAIQ